LSSIPDCGRPETVSADAALDDLTTAQKLHPSRRRVLLVIAGVTLIAATGVAAWSFGIRDKFVPKRFGVVIPDKVYRSGQISRRLIGPVIDRYHIGAIVDLNGFDKNDPDQQAEVTISQSKGVHHFRFPLKGNGTGQIERYADAVATIVRSEREGVPVLVHCYAGTQRTGGCISFYRLLVRRDPPAGVYQDLGRYGWDAASDQILVDYVNSNMRTMAELLVQRHALDRVPDEIPRLEP
jgi:Tyrosine phosphatase family